MREETLVCGTLVAAWAGTAVALQLLIAAPLPPVPQPSISVPTLAFDALHSLTAMDADLLTAVAISEDYAAAAAVMHVVVNRAKRCGCSILEVVAEREQFHGWVRGEDPRQRWGAAWEPARRRYRGLADAVLSGALADPTQGATHFHAVGSWTPTWAPEETAWVEVGRTYFYGG